MKRWIGVQLNGLDKAIAQIKKVEKEIEDKIAKLVERLAEHGLLVAQIYYSTAEYAGDNDVVVRAQRISDNSWKIIAEGNATLFIEFGTGVTMPDAPQARAELKSGNPVGHGEYGQGKGAHEKGWFYPGTVGNIAPSNTEPSYKYPGLIHTYGNPATPAMYYTQNQLHRIVNKTAKEIFR